MPVAAQHDVFQGGEVGDQMKRLEHEAAVTPAQRGARVFVEAAERLAGEAHVAAAGHVQAGQQTQ